MLVDAKLNIIKKVSSFFFFAPSHGFGKMAQNTDAEYRLTEPLLEDESMNKLLIALFAGAFAFISASAFADDSSLMPLSKMDTEHAKAARAEAVAKWAQMTPQEQAAAKKAARAKKLADANAIDMIANDNMQYTPPTKEEAAASKAVPKATKEQRQKDLAEQAKKASGQ